MNWVTVQKAIQNWLVTGSGLAANHVIWEGQSSPRPAPPFISLNLLSITGRGQDWVNHVDEFLVVADDEVEAVDVPNDELDLTGHGLLTGDGPFRFTTTNTLPAGMAILTDYWVIKSTNDAISLASTFVRAISAIPTKVVLTGVGVGTHTLTDTSTTTRAGIEILHTARGVRSCVVSVQCYAETPVGVAGAVQILADAVAARLLPSVADALVTAGIGVAGFDPISAVGSPVGGGSAFEPRAQTNIRFFSLFPAIK